MSLPTGSVTFLFADVEGSTELARQLGADWGRRRAACLETVGAAVRDAGGTVVDAHADELFAAFGGSRPAAAAALAIHAALAAHLPLRVRIGLHTGEPVIESGARYVGLDVHLARRVCSAARGGQTLVSETTARLLDTADDLLLADAGPHVLAGFPRPQRLSDLRPPGAPAPEQRPEPALPAEPVRQSSRGDLEALAHRLRGARVADGPANEGLIALARSAFDAGRAVDEAQRLLDDIDRDWLERRRQERRAAGVDSPAARAAAARLSAQLAALDAVAARIDDLLAEAGQAADVLPQLATADAGVAAALREDLARRVGALEEASAHARAGLPADARRLTRTRHRGVYRLGERYVVVTFDEVGGERRVAFETVREARDFRTGLVAAEKTQREPTPMPLGGAGGGGLI